MAEKKGIAVGMGSTLHTGRSKHSHGGGKLLPKLPRLGTISGRKRQNLLTQKSHSERLQSELISHGMMTGVSVVNPVAICVVVLAASLEVA